MEIEIGKTRARPFLVFCMKLIGAEEDDRPFIIKEAYQNGVLVDYINSIMIDSLDGITEVILCFYESLECNVLAMANCLTKGEDFFIESSSTESEFITNTKIISPLVDPVKRHGSVKYRKGKVEVLSAGLFANINVEFTETVFKCGSTSLSRAFFSALRTLKNMKNADIDDDATEVGYFRVPLKICLWCEKPFLGQRYDQRFCSRYHSQCWFNKQARDKKHVEEGAEE